MNEKADNVNRHSKCRKDCVIYILIDYVISAQNQIKKMKSRLSNIKKKKK